MKILVITREYPPYTKGGMSNFIFQAAAESSKYGIDVTVIANHPGTGIYKEQQGEIDVYRVPWGGSTFLTQLPVFSFFASKLAKKMQGDFDLIYSNYTPLFGSFNKPFIAGFQATRIGEYRACIEAGKYLQAFLNRMYIPFDSKLLSKANTVIALSDKMIHELTSTLNSNINVEVIPNGVDEKTFYPLGFKRFNNSEKEILFVGRLDSRKNVKILLEALKIIKTKIRFRLTVAGTGREFYSLKKYADQSGLEVNFPGHLEKNNLPEIYSKADLFVLPSLYEGIPLAALEAMACATPTIISDGSPDMGVPQFKRNDSKELSDMILYLLSSSSRLEDLSKKSYQVSQEFRWDYILNKFFTLIKSYKK